MTDELVSRLRAVADRISREWQRLPEGVESELLFQAANRIAELERALRDARKDLKRFDLVGPEDGTGGSDPEIARIDAALSGTTPPADALVEALELITQMHVPDQPAYSADDELTWAKRHVGNIRSLARAALTSHRAEKENDNG